MVSPPLADCITGGASSAPGRSGWGTPVDARAAPPAAMPPAATLLAPLLAPLAARAP